MSTLARNTLYLTAASIAQKVIAFVYFTLVANQIGPAAQGDYFLALGITTILSVVSDWGLSSVLIREVAHDPPSARRLCRSTLGLKIPLIGLAMVGSIGLASLLRYDVAVIQLVALATLILAADAISLTFFGILRGLQNLRYEALGIFIGQLISSIIGLIALSLHPTLSVLILALLVGSTWNAFYSASRVVKHLGFGAIVPSFNLPLTRHLLRLSLAFAIASLFVKVYSYVDSILIKHFLGSAAVGVYSIAYKITYAFQFLPLAFIGGLYPAFSSRFARGDRAGLGRLFDDAIWYTALMAAPIVFGIWALSDQIIGRFYPGYVDAIGPLSIEIFALLPLFLDFPIGSLLNAAHKQHIKTTIMGATMVVNAVLNAILIPRLGTSGAAITAVIAFSLMFLMGLFVVPRLIPYTWSQLLRRVGPIFICGLLMGLIVLALKNFLPLPLTILIGAGSYGLLLWLSGSLTAEHLRYFRRLLKPAERTIEV